MRFTKHCELVHPIIITSEITSELKEAGVKEKGITVGKVGQSFQKEDSFTSKRLKF